MVRSYIAQCSSHLSIMLLVIAAVIAGPSDRVVLQNYATMFMCTFEANPTPFQYMWHFTDSTGTTEVLNANNKYVILSSSDGNNFSITLNITSTVYDDRGTYNCSATNLVNDIQYTASASATLIVYGKY